MRPIEHRTDLNFHQALRCVEYRLPKLGKMKRPAYEHSLALRYGLIGAAASHHLLLSSNDEEEVALMDGIARWPVAVEEHFRWEVMSRVPIEKHPLLPATLANYAYQPMVSYLDAYRCLKPLEECLEYAYEAYAKENAEDIRSGWSWFQNRGAMKEFRQAAMDSVRYALMFFERRQANLDEVPEIALLGE